MLISWLYNLTYLAGIAIFTIFGFVVGGKTWNIFKLPELNKIDKLIINTVLGWGLMGYLIWLIGLTGLNLTISIYFLSFLIAVAAVIELKKIRKIPKIKIPKLNIIQIIIVFFSVVFLLISLIGALAPERAFDATWYHLPEAKWFSQNNSTRTIYPSMLGSSSVAPKLPEILFMWLMAFGKNEMLPHLLQWLSALGMGLAAYSIAQRFTTKTNALLAALLLFSSREILWLSTNAYIDNIYGLFGAATCLAIFAFAEKIKKTNRWPFIIIIGILSGLMLATKMQAVVFIPAIMLGVLAITRKTKYALLSAIISLVVVFPWYLEIWLTTGNPFTVIAVAPPGDEHLGGGQSFSEWVFKIHPRTFFSATLASLKFSFPVAILAATPFLFWKKLNNKLKIFMLVILLSWLGWTYVPVHLVRYMMPLFPLIAVAVAVSFDYLSRPLKPILWLAIILIMIFNLATIINYNRGVAGYVMGFESKHQLMTILNKGSVFTFYDYDGAVKNIVQSGGVLGMIHNSFYAPGRYYDAVAFGEKYKTFDTADEIYYQLQQEKITWILTYGPYSIDSIVNELNMHDDEEIRKFKEKINLVYSNESRTNLYEIKK